MTKLNLLDIIIIIILGYCLIRGFFRGLIKEMSSIIGVLCGFYVGNAYYSIFATRLSEAWNISLAYSNILVFMLLFCGVLVFVSILGVIIKYLMNIAFLGGVDRICGMFFGIAKGVLITSVLLMILTAFLPKDSVIKKSFLSRHIINISEFITKMAAENVKKEFSTKIVELKNNWNLPL